MGLSVAQLMMVVAARAVETFRSLPQEGPLVVMLMQQHDSMECVSPQAGELAHQEEAAIAVVALH
jgi:hypothetical protein